MGDKMSDSALFDLYPAANVVGSKVVTDNIDFSFLISTKYVSSSQEDTFGLRVMIVWDSSSFTHDIDGVLFLSSDYSYVPVPGYYIPSEKELGAARKFFRKYIVLFAAAWEEVIDTGEIPAYFRGFISFEELKNAFYEGNSLISQATSIEDLERIFRENNIIELPI